MIGSIRDFLRTYMPIDIRFTDIIEIILLSFLVYNVLVWIKNTRAWTLFKGILVLIMLYSVA